MWFAWFCRVSKFCRGCHQTLEWRLASSKYQGDEDMAECLNSGSKGLWSNVSLQTCNFWLVLSQSTHLSQGPLHVAVIWHLVAWKMLHCDLYELVKGANFSWRKWDYTRVSSNPWISIQVGYYLEKVSLKYAVEFINKSLCTYPGVLSSEYCKTMLGNVCFGIIYMLILDMYVLILRLWPVYIHWSTCSINSGVDTIFIDGDCNADCNNCTRIVRYGTYSSWLLRL